MKTLFNSFWIGSYMGSEETTLYQLDLYNKTRYSRRKNQEGLLEIASREAHEKKKTYYATILQEDDTPYCAIRTDGGYFGIDFLRTDLESYLIYIYREPEESIGVNKDKLFLKGLFLLPKGKEYFDEINTMEISITPDGNGEDIYTKVTLAHGKILQQSILPYQRKRLSYFGWTTLSLGNMMNLFVWIVCHIKYRSGYLNIQNRHTLTSVSIY